MRKVHREGGVSCVARLILRARLVFGARYSCEADMCGSCQAVVVLCAQGRVAVHNGDSPSFQLVQCCPSCSWTSNTQAAGLAPCVFGVALCGCQMLVVGIAAHDTVAHRRWQRLLRWPMDVCGFIWFGSVLLAARAMCKAHSGGKACCVATRASFAAL